MPFLYVELQDIQLASKVQYSSEVYSVELGNYYPEGPCTVRAPCLPLSFPLVQLKDTVLGRVPRVDANPTMTNPIMQTF